MRRGGVTGRRAEQKETGRRGNISEREAVMAARRCAWSSGIWADMI